MEFLVIAVALLIAIALTTHISERIGVASPLILLTLGVIIGFLPQVNPIELAPEILIDIILPPLLFGAAVSMPVMDFRRDLIAVAGLAGGLVVLTTVVLGFLIHWLVPTIALPWAFALGAVLSPTDAVAVSMTKRSGVSHRIVTVLEGEGLFNDATALVLLSSAISAARRVDGGTLHPAAVAADFCQALLLAIAIGWVVGEIGVRIRSRITRPATDTVFSFAMPFLASLPTEHLGGSGLVAAVVAGLIVSHRRAVMIPAMHRVFSQLNWRTLEMILEGFVFLTMGLQAFGIAQDVSTTSADLGVRSAAILAVILGVCTLLIRGAFVAPFLWWMSWSHRRFGARLERSEERLRAIEDRIVHACDTADDLLEIENSSPAQWNKAVRQWHARLEKERRAHRRRGSDFAYFSREPLGPREGAVVVWAGMRGAITLAAAQTLPLSTPARSFLLLATLFVAVGSLVFQGLTMPWFIRLVKPLKAEDAHDEEEREKLLALLGSILKESALAQALAEGRSSPKLRRVGESMVLARAHVPRPVSPPSTAAGTSGPSGDAAAHGAENTSGAAKVPKPLTEAQMKALAVEAIREQREALMDARDEGLFSAQALACALERLDQEEIMLTSLRH